MTRTDLSSTSVSAPTTPPSPATGLPVPVGPAKSHRWRALPWAAVALLSLAVGGFAVGQYATASLAVLSANNSPMAASYASRPLWLQVTFYAHISAAGLALFVGPFQFLKPLRDRALRLHRVTGVLYVGAIAIGSVAGFVMAFVNRAGLVGTFGFGTLAVVWAWVTYQGLRAALRGDLPSHKAWMIRSFALTFAVVTLRLQIGLFTVGQIAAGATDAAQIFANAYAVVPFLCWLPNLVVAELMIRRRDLPGLRYVDGSSARSARRRVAVDAA